MIEEKLNAGPAKEPQNLAHWILWIFYYNPDDKRLLPPKRIPWMGWTVNFANPYSIALSMVLIIGVLAIGTLLGGRYLHF